MNSTTTKIFLYHQRHRVVLLDTSGDYFSRRYRQVYTKNLIAHRGTDNQILIEFVNQDQKRVDLRRTSLGATVTAGSFVTGTEYEILTVGTTDFTLIGAADNNVGTTFTATGAGVGDGTAGTIVYTELQFTCRLISHDGSKLILEKALDMVNATVGQTKLVLTEQELDLIAPGRVGFSVEQTLDGSLYEPVYVDDHSGGRGYMNIVDSIMPSFIASETLTIPTGQPGFPTPIVTSILNTDDVFLQTFQLELDNFTGSIAVEGATDTDNNWYTIQTESIIASDLYNFNVEGYHPYIRLTISENPIVATELVTGVEYEIVTAGTTDFTLIGAANNSIGTVFTATGPGTGDGTAKPTDPGTITEIRYR